MIDERKGWRFCLACCVRGAWDALPQELLKAPGLEIARWSQAGVPLRVCGGPPGKLAPECWESENRSEEIRFDPAGN